MQAAGSSPVVHKMGTDAVDDRAITVYQMSAHAIELAKRAAAVAEPQLLRKPPIKVMGRDLQMPRNVGLFSLPFATTGALVTKQYRFSRQTVPALLASGPVAELICAMNREFGTNCNATLVNEYPADDTSSIGAHGDDEKGLDTSRGVFGINLYDDIPNGELRKMVFVDRATSNKLEIILEPNTIFAMTGDDFQRTVTHQIPKRKRAARRTSFTFREHVTNAPVASNKRRAEEAPRAGASKRVCE
jgi:alkylated DNA repair dioxygenase AlkB